MKSAIFPSDFPGVDLALLHLGGMKILKTVLVTMDAKQGVKMMKIIAPQHALPIHYNDYDVFTSLIEDFKKQIEAAGWPAGQSHLSKAWRNLPLPLI